MGLFHSTMDAFYDAPYHAADSCVLADRKGSVFSACDTAWLCLPTGVSGDIC